MGPQLLPTYNESDLHFSTKWSLFPTLDKALLVRKDVEQTSADGPHIMVVSAFSSAERVSRFHG